MAKNTTARAFESREAFIAYNSKQTKTWLGKALSTETGDDWSSMAFDYPAKELAAKLADLQGWSEEGLAENAEEIRKLDEAEDDDLEAGADYEEVDQLWANTPNTDLMDDDDEDLLKEEAEIQAEEAADFIEERTSIVNPAEPVDFDPITGPPVTEEELAATRAKIAAGETAKIKDLLAQLAAEKTQLNRKKIRAALRKAGYRISDHRDDHPRAQATPAAKPAKKAKGKAKKK